MADDDYDRQEKFEAGIPEAITMLEGLISRLEEKKADLETAVGPAAANTFSVTSTGKVFVVHGRDEGKKDTVARLLQQLDLKPIVLREQPNEGRTIIEKFEKYSDVAYAVVLLTGDDQGGLKGHLPEQYKPRARQNVVLELGFFLAKLGRDHVCPLYEKDVEIPSDYEGVLYVELDDAGRWKLQLAKEMKAAGLDVDLNKVL